MKDDIMDLKESNILLNQRFDKKEEAIRAVGELLVADGAVDSDYIEAMLAREDIVTTHMGNFIAIPHGTDDGKEHVKTTSISIVQVPHGVDFAAEDEEEEKMAMMIFGIAGVGDEHLDLLSKIAIACSDVENVVRLTNAENSEEIIEIIEGEIGE